MRTLIPWLLLLCLTTLVPAQDDAKIKRWLDQVAKGDQSEADEAADRIVARLTDPLVEAIGSMESRPAAEQRRIRALSSRLTGALRSKLFRLDLPEEDRKLFDAFAKQYSELARRLFEDDPHVRLSALRQIPLEADTGAGVMIAARVDDTDPDVIDAAIEAAGKLHDAVVARGIARQLDSIVAALDSHVYGPNQSDLEIALTDFAHKIAVVLGRTGVRAAAPAVARAVKYFQHAPHRENFEIADAALALGDLGDEAAAPVLLDLLDSAEPRRNLGVENGRMARQNVGDAALLALTRIYQLDPQAFGLLLSPNDRTFGGFDSDEARTAAVRQFRIWYKTNADKPAGQRTPATRPAKDG